MQNSYLYDQATEAAQLIRARSSLLPTVAVVLGSGLGGFVAKVENAVSVPYSEIPHFPETTVRGHSGCIVLGSIGETPVIVMEGRVHAYEGYTAEQVAFPIRVLGCLGVRSLILTNAAGAIRTTFRQGQLVLLSDHINMTGQSPVIGTNDERFGPRFFDMSEAYSLRLRSLAQHASQSMDFSLEEGVYLGVLGPSFETPAEIRAFRALGADLVGMSTVLETIAARHMGVTVLGISCVTNMAAGVADHPLSHEEVIETGAQVEELLAGLLIRLIPAIARETHS